MLVARAVERDVERQRRRRREQRVEIAIVRRERRVPAAADRCEPLQARGIELRHDDLAVAVGNEAAFGARNRPALLGAYREHADAETVARQIAGKVEIRVGNLGVRDDQDVAAAEARLPEQRRRALEARGDAAALRRHDVGVDGGHERGNRARVRRQRRHRERVRREHDQRRLPRRTPLEQIEQLELGAR